MATSDDVDQVATDPDPDRPAAPEDFSHASARASLHALIYAIPKSKLPNYLGEFNTVGIVLDRLFVRAGVHTNKGL